MFRRRRKDWISLSMNFCLRFVLLRMLTVGLLRSSDVERRNMRLVWRGGDARAAQHENITERELSELNNFFRLHLYMKQSRQSSSWIVCDLDDLVQKYQVNKQAQLAELDYTMDGR